nr:MAG TPA: hypothetical protein [Caudoviricetes sp.]
MIVHDPVTEHPLLRKLIFISFFFFPMVMYHLSYIFCYLTIFFSDFA